MNFEKLQRFFLFLLPSSKSTTRNTEFVTFLLGLPFSSSCNASYITFKVSSWCFLFVAIFIASATINRIQTNLKISKHSNWNIRNYYSRISKDEKTRLRKENSNYMMKNTSRAPKNLFDLDDFSNYVSPN